MADNTPLATASENPASVVSSQQQQQQQQQVQNHQAQQDADMIVDEDPLLISQTLTYVTDDGSVLHSFQSSPFSFGFKLRFIILEVIFVVLVICAVPIGAHGTIVCISVANLLVLAWFWYNLVRSVDVTDDGTLRFWIGNIEIDVPFDKIVSIRRSASTSLCASLSLSMYPYRGFLSTPTDGVAIVTNVPSTPFWLWPRSAGKPDRSCCFGIFACPKLTVVFSPTGGSLNFIREVENEMRNFSNGISRSKSKSKSATVPTANPDFLDV